MFTRISLCLILLCFLLSPAVSLGTPKFQNFKIISADTLNYQEGESVLLGDVHIKVGDYIIIAPRVLITKDPNADDKIIRFLEGVDIQSDKLKLEANELKVTLAKHLLEAITKDGLVKSCLKSKGGDITITAPQQYFDYEKNFFTTVGATELTQKALTITSKSSNFFYEPEANQLISANFVDDVVFVDEDKRVEADKIHYFPPQALMKALDDVKILYFNDQALYLLADFVTYSESDELLAAFSNQMEGDVEVFAKNLKSKSRELQLKFDGKKPDRIILTGNAFAQYGTKAIKNEEVIFDLKKNQLISLMGRPKTIIYRGVQTKPQSKD